MWEGSIHRPQADWLLAQFVSPAFLDGLSASWPTCSPTWYRWPACCPRSVIVLIKLSVPQCAGTSGLFRVLLFCCCCCCFFSQISAALKQLFKSSRNKIHSWSWSMFAVETICKHRGSSKCFELHFEHMLLFSEREIWGTCAKSKNLIYCSTNAYFALCSAQQHLFYFIY